MLSPASRLNACAQPYTPKQKETKPKCIDQELRGIINKLSDSTLEGFKREMIRKIRQYTVDDNTFKSIVDVIMEAASANYKRIMVDGNIPHICEICKALDHAIKQQNYNSHGLLNTILEKCLTKLDERKNNLEYDVSEKDSKTLGPLSLLAHLSYTNWENLGTHRQKLTDYLIILSAQSTTTICAILIYRKIAQKLDDEVRLNLEENFNEHCKEAKPTAKSSIIQDVFTAMKKESEVAEMLLLNFATNCDKNCPSDDEGSESSVSQQTQDSESEQISCTSSCTPNMMESLSYLMSEPRKNEYEINQWLNKFREYIRTMDDRIQDKPFQHQLVVYLTELAVVVQHDTLKKIATVCAEFHHKQVEMIKRMPDGQEKTNAYKDKFRSNLTVSCKAEYNKSYLTNFLSESAKNRVIAITRFIAALYEADVFYAPIITDEIKSLLTKNVLTELRLRCAIILLNDCYKRLDKSCRIEISSLYDSVKEYRKGVNCEILAREIDELIAKREKDMDDLKMSQPNQSIQTSPQPRRYVNNKVDGNRVTQKYQKTQRNYGKVQSKNQN